MSFLIKQSQFSTNGFYMEITKDNKKICISQNYWQIILKDGGRLRRCIELNQQYSKQLQNIELCLERVAGEPHILIKKNGVDISLPLQLWDQMCAVMANNLSDGPDFSIDVQTTPQGVVMTVSRGARYVTLSEKSISILYDNREKITAAMVAGEEITDISLDADKKASVERFEGGMYLCIQTMGKYYFNLNHSQWNDLKWEIYLYQAGSSRNEDLPLDYRRRVSLFKWNNTFQKFFTRESLAQWMLDNKARGTITQEDGYVNVVDIYVYYLNYVMTPKIHALVSENCQGCIGDELDPKTHSCLNDWSVHVDLYFDKVFQSVDKVLCNTVLWSRITDAVFHEKIPKPLHGVPRVREILKNQEVPPIEYVYLLHSLEI